MGALVQARATVHLVGLGPDDPVWVDPDDPQVARWLRGGQLVRIDDAPASPEGDTPTTPVPRETPRRRRPKK